MHRPLGLTLFALLYIAYGVLGVPVGIIMFLFRYLETTRFALLMLYSFVSVVLGIGLWSKRNWARWAAIILVLGNFLTKIVFAAFLPMAFGLSWRQMKLVVPHNIIDVLMVIYLFTPRVRESFLSTDAEARL
jgi:hypothetical protein